MSVVEKVLVTWARGEPHASEQSVCRLVTAVRTLAQPGSSDLGTAVKFLKTVMPAQWSMCEAQLQRRLRQEDRLSPEVWGQSKKH